ncbi:MAG TPA: thymidine phosphorylase, partial [Anaeromyxobacteraceae bacterium]
AVVEDGSAFLKLRQIVRAQGGDPDALVDLTLLPSAEGTLEVAAPTGGTVQAIDAEAIGLAAVALGAGRSRVDDPVDHGVGLMVLKKVGDRVEAGEPLATVHFGMRGEPAAAVADRVRRAYQIGVQELPPEPILLGRIG